MWWQAYGLSSRTREVAMSAPIRMKSRFAFLPLLLASALLVSLGGVGPPEAQAACNGGQITLGGKHFVFYKRVISCQKAIGLARQTYRTNKAPRGWRCPDASPGNNRRDGANCSKLRNPDKAYGYHAFD
jgi:hypothetical protein